MQTHQFQLFQVEIQYTLSGTLKHVPGIKFYQVAADSFGKAAEIAKDTATLCGFEDAKAINVRAEGEVLVPMDEIVAIAAEPPFPKGLTFRE